MDLLRDAETDDTVIGAGPQPPTLVRVGQLEARWAN
jgi:hypothetical protein